jgi:hypothetical protein
MCHRQCKRLGAFRTEIVYRGRIEGEDSRKSRDVIVNMITEAERQAVLEDLIVRRR